MRSVVLQGHEVGEAFGAGLAAEVASLVALPVIDEAASVLVGAAAHLTAEGRSELASVWQPFSAVSNLGSISSPFTVAFLPFTARPSQASSFTLLALLQGLHLSSF